MLFLFFGSSGAWHREVTNKLRLSEFLMLYLVLTQTQTFDKHD